MSLTAVQAIEAMTAPVVLITAAAILSSSILGLYGAINDRMRSMDAERLELLSAPDGSLQAAAHLPAARRVRLAQIDQQLPELLRRHRVLHNAVLTIYVSVAVIVVAVLFLAVSVVASANAVGVVALVLVVGGTGGILAGLALSAQSIVMSQSAIDFEVHDTLLLGSGDTP